MTRFSVLYRESFSRSLPDVEMRLSLREFAEWELLDGMTRARRYDEGDAFAHWMFGALHDACNCDCHFLAYTDPRGVEDVGSI